MYNLLCDSLGLKPKPNNGTLRLPLKPIGTHKAEDEPEVPVDPVTSYSVVSTSTSTSTTSSQPVKTQDIQRPSVPPEPTSSSSALSSSSTSSLSSTTSTSVKSHTTTSEAVATPTEKPSDDNKGDEDDDDNEGSGGLKGIWDWLSNEIDKVWHKITDGSGSS